MLFKILMRDLFWFLCYSKSMYKQWIIAILGLIYILTPFLGLTTFVFKLFMALGGVVFTILGFWLISEERLKKETEAERPHEF